MSIQTFASLDNRQSIDGIADARRSGGERGKERAGENGTGKSMELIVNCRFSPRLPIPNNNILITRSCFDSNSPSFLFVISFAVNRGFYLLQFHKYTYWRRIRKMKLFLAFNIFMHGRRRFQLERINLTTSVRFFIPFRGQKFAWRYRKSVEPVIDPSTVSERGSQRVVESKIRNFANLGDFYAPVKFGRDLIKRVIKPEQTNWPIFVHQPLATRQSGGRRTFQK